MALQLPDRPARHFIDEVLLPAWDPAEAVGFDPSVETDDAAFLPVATTIDNVGAVYPSLIVQYSNETSGGETTYDFMTSSGPGQHRTGTLIATARAQDRNGGYTGDSGTFDAEPAEDVVVALVEAVENVCQRRAHAPDSEFDSIGSQRGPDAPDDFNADPPVRLATTQIAYSWSRTP